MKNLMQIISDVPALKGTFIEDFFKVMQSGQYNDQDEPVADDEKVIGEMNESEKVLSTLFDQYAENYRKIATRLSGDAEPFSSEEMPKLKAELKSCEARLEVAKSLLWESIRTRLASQNTPLATGWAIKSGYQIVLMFDDRKRNLFRSMIGLTLVREMMQE
jgi:nitrogen fixation-related uncharacterized protein